MYLNVGNISRHYKIETIVVLDAEPDQLSIIKREEDKNQYG